MFGIKVVEKIKVHILYSVAFSENRGVAHVTSKNMVESEAPQMNLQYGA
jgi:hypothetical protein